MHLLGEVLICVRLKLGERLAVPAAPAVGGPACRCCSSQVDSIPPPAAGSHQAFSVHSRTREREHGVSGEERGPCWAQVIREGDTGTGSRAAVVVKIELDTDQTTTEERV